MCKDDGDASGCDLPFQRNSSRSLHGENGALRAECQVHHRSFLSIFIGRMNGRMGGREDEGRASLAAPGVL